jgi:xylan 1,4-beta-xylosidase
VSRAGKRANHAWVAALLLLSVPAPADAGVPAVSIAVDATAPSGPLERVWPFYGYDEINYTTTPDGRQLLRTLADAHSAPVHVRSHFLLNTGDGTPAPKWGSTNVYTEDADGNPVFSWTLTDGILDAIIGAGALPFVELGFMPEALSTQPTPYANSSSTALDGGCFHPPDDYAKWAELIRAWATHANERYPDAGERWLWELWNEPDIAYWSGTFEEFAQLYDYTEAALHDVIPTAVLGGPAAAGAGGSFLTRFLEHCATGTNAVTGELGTRLDLVSFHAKGGVALVGSNVQMNLGNQLRLHRMGFESVARYPQFEQTPIYITEADPEGCAACPVSSHPENAYRNSTAYGAYELAMMKHSIELAAEVGVNLGGVLTWAFTFPETPYFAGYRALATNGISLPVLGAFTLLGRLAGSRLPLTSSGALPLDDVVANGVRDEPQIDGMAALEGDAVRVLVWNYHDDLVAVAPAPVRLAITVPASFGARVLVSHTRVDEAHGDAYSAWVSQGSPPAPTAEQIAALERAMEPAPLVPDESIAVSPDGSVLLDFELPRFGVSLVTVTPDRLGGEGDSTAPHGAGGCACRAGSHGRDATTAWSLLGVGILAVGAGARHRKRWKHAGARHRSRP